MTFEKLCKVIEINKVPKNVVLMSDSGWECDATHMNGIFYNESENVLVFTQTEDEWKYSENPEWKGLV